MENLNKFLEQVEALEISNNNGDLDMSKYSQENKTNEDYYLKKLQRPALLDILNLPHYAIKQQLTNLNKINARFNKFWDWFLEQWHQFDYGRLDELEFMLKMESFFIIPHYEHGIIKRTFMHDLHDAAMFKQAYLSGLIKQLTEEFPALATKNESKPYTPLLALFNSTNKEEEISKTYKRHPDGFDALRYPSEILKLHKRACEYRYITILDFGEIPIPNFALLVLEEEGVDFLTLPLEEYASGFFTGYHSSLIPFIDTPKARKELILDEGILKGGKGFPVHHMDGDVFYNGEDLFVIGVSEGRRYKAWEYIFESPLQFLPEIKEILGGSNINTNGSISPADKLNPTPTAGQIALFFYYLIETKIEKLGTGKTKFQPLLKKYGMEISYKNVYNLYVEIGKDKKDDPMNLKNLVFIIRELLPSYPAALCLAKNDAYTKEREI